MNVRDRAYWRDQLNAFYISRGFGVYADAVEAFAKDYPEFRQFSDAYGKDQVKNDFVKYLTARFREADNKEHEAPQPTPPHIRQQFLPLHIDVPPMSPSVNAFDGQGRLSMTDATPKQHRRHHGEIKKFHKRGASYREAAEEKWTELIETLKHRLPTFDHPENLPLRELLEQLQTVMATESRDASTSEAPPPAL